MCWHTHSCTRACVYVRPCLGQRTEPQNEFSVMFSDIWFGVYHTIRVNDNHERKVNSMGNWNECHSNGLEFPPLISTFTLQLWEIGIFHWFPEFRVSIPDFICRQWCEVRDYHWKFLNCRNMPAWYFRWDSSGQIHVILLGRMTLPNCLGA